RAIDEASSAALATSVRTLSRRAVACATREENASAMRRVGVAMPCAPAYTPARMLSSAPHRALLMLRPRLYVAAIGVAVFAGACDPCSGVTACTGSAHVSGTGRVLDDRTGHPVAGVVIDFVRT